MSRTLRIAGETIAPGERRSLRIPVGRRSTQADVFLPTSVMNGSAEGPTLFVCAALHGDEINGVEIIRRLLRRPELARLRGALIAVPIVNVYGFIAHSRYTPDRRDVNRSFPGSPRGSLAARLADQFLNQVVAPASHGIDLHTGALHRANLPQVRARLSDAASARMARAFGAPVILDSDVRDGSLRKELTARQLPMLVYEGGEALRFDETAIRAGLRGVLAVMRSLRMLPAARRAAPHPRPFVARTSHWVRAPEGGILRADAQLGQHVAAGEVLGIISDPLGEEECPVVAQRAGLVIGQTRLPLANEGDALFHVASVERPASVAGAVKSFHEELDRFDDLG